MKEATKDRLWYYSGKVLTLPMKFCGLVYLASGVINRDLGDFGIGMAWYSAGSAGGWILEDIHYSSRIERILLEIEEKSREVEGKDVNRAVRNNS